MALQARLSLSCVACFLLHASTSAAQTVAATGAITGRVTDSTGAVLPGAAIEISSDALMGNRTTITSAEGLYRFPAVPPGEYSLVFTREGFAAVRREAVHVGIGFTATVDAELGLAALRDHVAVERGSSPIDGRSTAIGASLDARQLANLPGSRSLFAILAATPAVHVTRFEVGGSSGEAGSPYGAYGTIGANLPMIDGIIASGIFPMGFMLNYGSFEEASVGVAAHSAEWPLPGVQMQIVTKAGGNRYRGTVYADYQNKAWQAFNIDAGQIGRGATGGGGLSPRQANRLWRYYDFNADVGGYIRRDTLWWYVSGRDHEVSAQYVNFPVRPHRTHATSYDAKTTFQVSRNHKLVVFAQVGRNQQPNQLDPFGPVGGTLSATTAFHESDQSTLAQLSWGWIGKTDWTAVINENALFEIRVGQFGANRSQTPNGAARRFEDIGNLTVRGGNRDWQETLRRPQLLGSITYFKPGWLGNHEFKFGGEIIQTHGAEKWRQGYPGDVVHVLQNDVPFEVYVFQTPSTSESGVRAYGAYATDAWQVNDRLTFSLGLRFDRNRVYLPAQTHPPGRFNPTARMFAAVDNVISRNALAPRIGLIVALSGDGKTLAKVNYGLYSYGAGREFGASVNPNANQWWRRYAWSDPDGSGIWEPGEEGRLLGSRGGVAVESLDPDLKLKFMKEVAASVERELPARVGLRMGIVWRGEGQAFMRQNANRPFEAFTVPATIPDPGPDGRVGTGDDGRPIRVYDLAPELLSQPPVNVVRNVPAADSHYWAFEVVATRRFARRWSLVAGFEHTWSGDQSATYFGQSVRNNTLPVTPSDLINAGREGRHEFRTWSAKLHGTYDGPWGVRLTPLLRHQAGQPYGRTFSTTLSYGSVRILAEPIGARRMDNVTILDLRLEKGFTLPEGRRVAGFVDVFNLCNTNAEQNASWSSGSFLRPLTIVSPRIARVGAKLDW